MKATRQKAILEIIRQQDINTQEELAGALKKLNFNVTQATVSRDIKELRLLKTLSSEGVYRYTMVENVEHTLDERFRRIFSESVLSVSAAYNQIVLRTLSGSANVAAEMIDSIGWTEIIGTIAGDNAVLLIVRSIEDVEEIVTKINEMLR
ncbi:MAG TPA: arginine repressor [Candidatus Limiplasma sp.]|nr:arginine repressor [Candidatus Limiplasma sp.]